MTTTTRPPASAAPAATDGEQVSWYEDPLEVAREATLLLVNVAAVVSLGRLFAGGDHLMPLLLNVVMAHVVIAAMRRADQSLGLATVVAAAAALVAVVLTFYPGTTFALLPTGTSLDSLSTDVDAAFALFGEAPTPTEPLTGFLVLCAAAVWVSAFVADWAAFRLSVPLEALLPAGTVFVFAAVLADDHERTSATVVALGAAMSFLLVHRVSRQAREGRWVTGSSERGARALLGTGSVILVASIVAAVLGGPSLPGAGSEALVELEPSGSDAPRSRVTVSPLVDIRRRLVDQANVEVFTVTSDQRAYWRLTSLDSFDGRIWSSSGSYGRASGGLDRPVESSPVAEEAVQEFGIRALAAIWLPAAFEPRSVESEVDLRYDEFSATLIVDTDIADSDGITYSVSSALPRFDPASLDAAGTVYPAEILDSHLSLPPDFPDGVQALAREVVGDSTTPYAASLALQDFLRGFTYDLTVPEGHSGGDLERFLFVDQRGYCEQFAGAFAAMTRSLGIPTRVAVGFTPGIEIATGEYSVRGEHAHAWPEVYFPGLGWVPFEPTPGRGAPFAENYTRVPEQQAASGNPAGVEAAPIPPVDESPADDPDAEPEPDQATEPTEPEPETELLVPGDNDGTDEGDDDYTWLIRMAGVLGVAVLLAGGYVSLAYYLHHRRRTQRRRAAVTAPDRVRVAWDESLEELRLLGLLDDPTATHSETTRRAAGVLPRGEEHATTVGTLAEAAVYGPGDIGDEAVLVADHAAGQIAVVVRESTTRSTRAKRTLDLRPVLGGRIRRRVGEE